uniref:Uncharacterized protein n=1 Tax=Tanacetum cinerariifolium TaxID=118510 RepID=A0A699IT49_TANCI|nr:hypothetical protein [Tanacetum cinerariifolium]
MASAVICLSKGQKFNFSKYIFDSLVRNVDSSSKFYMYPRFIQLIIQNQVGDLSTHTTRFISPALTKKVFANMRRVRKGFSGVETPLFEGMLVARQPAEEGLVDEQVQVDDAVKENVAKDVAHDAIPSPPSHAIPSPSQEPSSPPQQPQSSPHAPPHDVEFPTQLQQVLNVCFALTKRVENLENDNAAQKLVFIKLKARVKKLEKANMVKSSKLRRLRKVGESRQVESSDDIKDVFNQWRMIDDIYKDEGIELVKDAEVAESEGRHAAQQTKKQATIYHIDLDHSSKVLSMQEDDSKVQEVVKVMTTAKLITEVVTAAASQVSAASATIPAASATIPAAAPTVVAAYTRRIKRVIIRDPEEELSLKTPAETSAKTPKIELDAEYARKLHEETSRGEFNKDIDWDAAIDHIYPIFQARFDKNIRFLFKSREEIEEEDQKIIKSINETPAQKAAKRRKLTTLLARKVPVVDYQIVLVDNKPRFKIIKADETHQFYISFTTLLKNFDREHLESLLRIVKDIFSTSKLTNFLDEYLLLTLKTMFEELDGQDAIWRNQKSIFVLVESRYLLSRFTLEQLVKVTRLQVEEESKMSLELLRDITSMTPDEGTVKTTPCPEGSLRVKDSGENIPPADMKPIHTHVADPSRTGAKYQVDETQFTRLRYWSLIKNEGNTSSEVEPDTEPFQLLTFADIQSFILSEDELEKESDEEKVLTVGDDMDGILRMMQKLELPHQTKLNLNYLMSKNLLLTHPVLSLKI